jgi:hypothetical protein
VKAGHLRLFTIATHTKPEKMLGEEETGEEGGE